MAWVSVLVGLAVFIYSQLQAVIEVCLVLVVGLGPTYVHGHNRESLTVAMTGLAIVFGFIVAGWEAGRRRR